jgi:glycosyltransferase involved in cell wall biosynthesis
MEKIAICITTHNRKLVFEQSVFAWKKFKPQNADIFVVDDCSIEAVESNFRFNENVGIATAKNKCLELAESYDHIFLTDDDVRPKVFGWEQKYINSGMNHLCLTYDKNSNKRHYSPSIREEGEEN